MTGLSDMAVVDGNRDFAPLHDAMQRYVNQEILAGVSTAVLAGRDLVDVHYAGWADREAGVELGPDHIFRAFSNTKLVTSCAALLLHEEGHFQLDDPIERFIPQLGERQVLRPDARDIADTEPAAGSITIRHLLSHSSGLTNDFLNPDGLINQRYTPMRDPAVTLSGMMDLLGDLPLVFHPGTSWEYSVATDVLGRLVEIISGQLLDEFFHYRIFRPLGMVDTDFFVPPEKHDRFTTIYDGADLMAPLQGGLTRNETVPFPKAYLQPAPRMSGAGGLVTTLPDMVALIRALMPGGDMLLRPESMDLIKTPQLPDGMTIRFPRMGDIKGKTYSAAGAVTLTPSSIDPPQSTGEVQWGGIGGTHWWFSPRHNIAGLVMTQRVMSFWHPFSFELKRLMYDAVLG